RPLSISSATILPAQPSARSAPSMPITANTPSCSRIRSNKATRGWSPCVDGRDHQKCRDLLRRLRPMIWLNTQSGYGALTKLLHWLVVMLFAFQFAAANIMLRLDAGATQLGLSQAIYYNWHKSIGLIALVVALLRLLVRKHGQLPDWAPTLSAAE